MLCAAANKNDDHSCNFDFYGYCSSRNSVASIHTRTLSCSRTYGPGGSRQKAAEESCRGISCPKLGRGAHGAVGGHLPGRDFDGFCWFGHRLACCVYPVLLKEGSRTAASAERTAKCEARDAKITTRRSDQSQEYMAAHLEARSLNTKELCVALVAELMLCAKLRYCIQVRDRFQPETPRCNSSALAVSLGVPGAHVVHTRQRDQLCVQNFLGKSTVHSRSLAARRRYVCLVKRAGKLRTWQRPACSFHVSPGRARKALPLRLSAGKFRQSSQATLI